MKQLVSSLRIVAMAAAVIVMGAGIAAASVFEDIAGHVSIGYAKLLVDQAPGGSISVAGGVDYPIAQDLRTGVEIGLHLLGTRTIERGSLVASLDYSVLDADFMLHWLPRHLGPVGRISAGPALFSARAELSTSGGGAAFSDLAIQEIAPGLAFDATLLRRSDSPVRVGLELGGRVGFLDQQTWTVATARLAFHY